MGDKNSNKNLQRIDKYMNSIGYAFTQKYLLVCLFCQYIADAAEITLLALILPCIEKDWNLSSFQKSIIGGIVFVGLFIGSLLSSKVSDLYGRKIVLLIGSFIIAFFGIVTTFAGSYLSFIVYRSFVGIGIGLIFPTITTIALEFTPTYGRSHFLNNIFISFPIGDLLVCLICYFNINQCNGWRTVILISSAPAIIALILTFFIYESPRFLLHQGRYDEAWEILNNLGKDKNISLTDIDKSEIISEIRNNENHYVEVSISSLLKDKFKPITIKIWISWMLASFAFYGFIYIYPQLLLKIGDSLNDNSNDNIYFKLVITSLITIPATPIGGFISETKTLGRKYSIALTFGLASIFSLFCLIAKSQIKVFGVFIKILVLIAFGILTVYTSEIYPTKIRTIGNAFANAVSKIGAITSPMILELSIYIFGLEGPFILISIFTLYNSYITYNFKIETFEVGIDSDFFIV